MKKYRRMLLLLLILAFQGFYLYNPNSTYSKLMERDRERIEKELLAEGVPPQQARVIQFALLDMNYNVATFTRDIGYLFLMTTCFMFAVLAPSRSEESKQSDL